MYVRSGCGLAVLTDKSTGLLEESPEATNACAFASTVRVARFANTKSKIIIPRFFIRFSLVHSWPIPVLAHSWSSSSLVNPRPAERHPLFLSELRCAIVSSLMIAQALNHCWSELLTLLIFLSLRRGRLDRLLE